MSHTNTWMNYDNLYYEQLAEMGAAKKGKV